jgi:hypothetical protein
MTTNRVENIDEAVHSRLHYSYKSKALDQSARECVWRLYISKPRIATDVFSDDDFQRWGRVEFNGRQVSNPVNSSSCFVNIYHRSRTLQE